MKIIMGALLLLLSTSIYAGDLKTTEEAQKISEKMLTYFVKSEFKEGLALVKPYWPLPEVELDGLVNKIETTWPIVEKRFGKSKGFELVRTEAIGKSFIRYYYLHKFQNHAIYWEIGFYKPSDKWIVNGITFEDTLEILYETVH